MNNATYFTQSLLEIGFATQNSINKDLTATQQVATPKSASQTSLNPDIKLNRGFVL